MEFLVSLARSLKHQIVIYISYFNRQKRIEKYLSSHKIKKLHLGCGDNKLVTWLNTDLNGIGSLAPIDVTKKLPIPDSSFHYVFSEHLIEHLTQDEGRRMLEEIFRVLKPGGKVRVATPDLKFLIDLYSPVKSPIRKKYISWTIAENPGFIRGNEVSYVINNFFKAWGHQFIYDYKTLKSELEFVGFIKIRSVKPGQSRDLNLKNIESHWRAIGKDFNNLETFVVEGTKPIS